MTVRLDHKYEHIISLENLLEAWKEFRRSKKQRKDVQYFEQNLMANIIALNEDLTTKRYKHSDYEAFNISDPKPRSIHKASVRDRLLHHAIYRILYPYFDKKFIHDSYSCRLYKGNHKALNRFRGLAFIESQNYTKTLWILKCDIRKFFATIDHNSLKNILKRFIYDNDICWLLNKIVDSFEPIKKGTGLPLGNLTSQLLVNIYMNELDQFVKRDLKIKNYIRYADDFVLMSTNKKYLEDKLRYIVVYLRTKLRLELHPNKVSITTLASGIDFLGWVHFPDHRVLRTTAKKRMFRRIAEMEGKSQTLQSYTGLISHGNTKKLQRILLLETVS